MAHCVRSRASLLAAALALLAALAVAALVVAVARRRPAPAAAAAEPFEEQQVQDPRVSEAVAAVAQQYNDALMRLYGAAAAADAVAGANLDELVSREELGAAVKQVYTDIDDVDARITREQRAISERIGRCVPSGDLQGTFSTKAEVEALLQGYALAPDVDAKLNGAVQAVSQAYASKEYADARFASLEALAELDRRVREAAGARESADWRMKKIDTALKDVVTQDEVRDRYLSKADAANMFQAAAVWGAAAKNASSLAQGMTLTAVALKDEVDAVAYSLQEGAVLVDRDVRTMASDLANKYLPTQEARALWDATYTDKPSFELQQQKAQDLTQRANDAERAAMQLKSRSDAAASLLCLQDGAQEGSAQVCVTAAHLAELRRVVEDYARVTGREAELRAAVEGQEARANQLAALTRQRQAELEAAIRAREELEARYTLEAQQRAAQQVSSFQSILEGAFNQADAQREAVRAATEQQLQALQDAQRALQETNSLGVQLQASHAVNEEQDTALESGLRAMQDAAAAEVRARVAAREAAAGELQELQAALDRLGQWRLDMLP